MVDSLNELEFSDPNGQLIVDRRALLLATDTVFNNAKDNDEALLFLDMLGIISPLPGNESKDSDRESRARSRQRKRKSSREKEGSDLQAKPRAERAERQEEQEAVLEEEEGKASSFVERARTMMSLCDICFSRNCTNIIEDTDCTCCRDHEI